MAYVYMILCDDNTLYTGITNDMAKRMKCHASGSGAGCAKYMRSHKPVSLAALWKTDEYKTAAKLEYAIKKRLCRRQKLELAENPHSVSVFFPHLSEFSFEPIIGARLEDFLN